MSTTLTVLGIEILNDNFANDNAWWGGFLARVAEGTGYWQIAEELGIKPALMRGWIGGDPKREEEYQTALGYRKEYRQEKALHRLAGLVDAEFDPELLNPTHVLKAIESTIGGNALKISGGVGGGAPVNIQINFVESADGRPA